MSISRITALSCVLVLSLGLAAAQGATIYNWTSGANNKAWNDPVNYWDQPTFPGSLLNGSGGTVLDDEVIIVNQSTSNNRTIRINAFDVGTIASLAIGGGKKQTTLQLRENASNLDVTGDLILGGVDGANQRVGNLTIGRGGNQSCTMTIGGNVISGSTADNDIQVNGVGATLTLAGNIDSVGVHEIDLRIQRGTFIWTGTEAYVEEFDLINTGNADVSSTFTLGPGQTLVSTQRSDIGRNASSAGQQNKTTTGTFNIFGGTASFTNTFESMVVGNVGNDPNGGTTTAVGVVNVGDATNAGILTLAGELKLGPTQADTKAGFQSGSGTLTISNAASIVTIDGGIEMAANNDEPGSATAVVTVNAGLLTVHKHLEDAVNSSTINLNGGTMHLATPGDILQGRAVDTFNMEDGATLKMTFAGATLPLTAPAMDLDVSAGAGSATLDIELPVANGAPTVLDGVEWDGGTGTWDASPTNWDPAALPANAASALLNGTAYTFLQTDGVLPIANQANIQLDAGDAATWTIDLTDPNKVQAMYTGTTMGFGAVVARISDPDDVITRDADLNVKNAVGEAADASQIDMIDGSLTLSGSANLILGAGSGTGNVNQSGGTVVIGGDLRFGGGNATDAGGTYHVTNDAVLTVTGSVVETDPAIATGGLYIDSANVTLGGTVISTDNFHIGQALGQTGSYTLTKDLTCTGSLYVGNEGTGTLTITGGTLTNLTGEFRLGSSATGVGVLNIAGTDPVIVKKGGGNFETAESGTGTAIFDNPNLIWYQNTNNFIVGQNTSSTASFTLNAGVVDLRGELGDQLGNLNTNKGAGHTLDLNGGQMLIGGPWQLTNDGAASVVATIDGATVRVGMNNTGGIAYRNNGTDTINFKSGLLDLTGGVIDADTTGTNAFNWTGGTLLDVIEFQGSLTQGNADAASLLQIGASPGTMDVTGDYTLSAAAANASTLEIEIFGDGTGGAGIDYDKLLVGGTATLDATSSISLVLDLYTPVGGESYDILDATAIVVVGSVNDLFDTSGAPLDPSLSWDFTTFETDGTVAVTPEPATMATFETDGTVAVTPEPATMALLVLGGLAVLGRRRRR